MTSRTPFPGLLLATGNAGRTLHPQKFVEETLRAHYGQPVNPYCRVTLGDWLVAYGLSARPSHANHYDGDDGISVIFDGYVLSSAGSMRDMPAADTFARTVADTYRKFGSAFATHLRGSFVALIVDQKVGRALLLNDRQGSRPLYVRRFGDGSLVFGPQVKLLASLNPELRQVDPTAVAQFLIRGCFYGSDTLYEAVQKLPQATLVTLTAGGLEKEQYWSFQFKAIAPRRSEAELLDEFDALLLQATRRLLGVARTPLLLLSGGLDSRLMLAYLVKAGASTIPTFSYRVNATTGDDHIVAEQLAALCGLAHETYTIHEKDFPAIAQKEVLAVDGRVQVLDSPSNRWEHIAERNGSIFVGDECFGWKQRVTTIADALQVVGWYNLDQTHRIADWLTPHVRQYASRQIKGIQRRLVSATGETIPDNIKDKLYYTERMGNMLNGYGARRLWLMEQARPFLDEDVIDFISRLPAERRHEKILAWKLMAAKHPALHAIPYARRTSVPWSPPQFTRIAAGNSEICNFLVSNLTDNLHPQLRDLVDIERFTATVRPLFRNQRLPHLKREWWVSVPGMWRLSQERHDKVGAVKGALRLLGLSLYLSG